MHSCTIFSDFLLEKDKIMSNLKKKNRYKKVICNKQRNNNNNTN